MEETTEETIVCAPPSDVQASESSCKRRKKPTSTARYSHQKKKTEHAQDRKPSALRRSSRLSQKTEDRKCLPERATGIVSGDISGRIQCDSSDHRAGAADDGIISIRNSPHYPPDKCEATVEVLAIEPQQRDGMPQIKIIPRLEKAEEDRLRCGQSSISPTHHNDHTPKVANNNTGNIPVRSHDRLDTRPVSKKTVATLDDISERKIHNASLSVRGKSPKASKSENEMAKKEAIPSSTTTKATSLPGIMSFQPDVLIGHKRNHDVQDRLLCIGLRELHERSLRPRFTYEEARWKEMQAQLLSVTNGVDQSNAKAEYYYL
ncbi:uncharacterized protein FTOL_09229 [Fusarium torulosum]|uniref:Uncharacterized protein n=1 Tax=Fusarium torulosum TaxID=33205 RepID=A0AAE8MEM5_9HYPO|nr:uncharacterized protein FTOL_09229 [Fusarium torulosum]